MLKLLLSGGAALCILALTGCGKPSDSFLQQCLSSSGEYSSNVPLSALVGAAESKGSNVSWRDGSGNSKILELSQTSQISTNPNVILMEIEGISEGERKAHCGPGLAFIKAVSINGEEQLGRARGAFADRFISVAEAFFRRQQTELGAQANVAPPSASMVSAPATKPSTDSVEDEGDSEAEYYAQRAEQAAKRPLSFADRDGNRFFGGTVERLLQRLAHGGAKGRIDTADDGTVWVEIDDPTGRWNGWRNIQFEMKPTPAMPGGLIITSMKADDQLVADISGNGPTPEDLLKPILPLR